MNNAIGRGVTEGRVLSEIGLTLLEQDERIAMIMVQELATESPSLALIGTH